MQNFSKGCPSRRLPRSGAFLGRFDAIHPFREGNGRTQLIFLTAIAEHAGHSLDPTRLDREGYLSAIMRSFNGDERRLAAQLQRAIA